MKKTITKLLAGLLASIGISLSHAAITDGRFGISQIFDVQYYWSGNTLYASNFIAPYDMNFTHPTVSAGQYFSFFPSTTNPGTYGLALYNSDSTVARVLHNTGNLTAIGPDAIFYVGSGFFGTVITPSAGYSYGQSGTFTNMDTTVTSTDLTNYTWASTTPLSSGQTASNSGPTLISSTTTNSTTSSTSYGTSTTSVTSVNGAPAVTTVETRSRGAQTDKTLTVTKTLTTTTVTPVTTTTTVTTPYTTTTTTTPVTVSTYSDSTTTTTNGTPTVTTTSGNTVTTTTALSTTSQVTATNQNYSTRIDQLSTLQNINQAGIKSWDSGVLSRNSVNSKRFNREDRNNFYVLGGNDSISRVDGYSASGRYYGVGTDLQAASDIVVGWQYINQNTTISQRNATGRNDREQFGVYGIYLVEDWIVKLDAAYARNLYQTSHAIPELSLSNNATTKGRDYWINAKTYAPDYHGFRPFVGVVATDVKRNAVAETGNELTAVSYGAYTNNQTVVQAGARYDQTIGPVTVSAEYTRMPNINLYSVGAGASLDKDVFVNLRAVRNDGPVVVQSLYGEIKILF